MSLSAEEYREHLQPPPCAPASASARSYCRARATVQVGEMRFHYLDWGNKHLPTDAVPAWRRTERAHLGSVLPGAARRLSLRRARPARPRRHRLGAGCGLFDARRSSTTPGVCRPARPRQVHPGRHVDGRDQLARLCDQSSGAAVALGDHRCRAGDAAAGLEPHPRFRQRRAPRPSSIEAIIEKALAIQPAARPEDPAPQPDARLRQQPDGTWIWKYDRRRFQQLDQRCALATSGAASPTASPRSTCPTLVVRGAESDVFHEEDGQRLAQHLPDGHYVTIPKAGHTVQGDNPKDLAAALREFLAP